MATSLTDLRTRASEQRFNPPQDSKKSREPLRGEVAGEARLGTTAKSISGVDPETGEILEKPIYDAAFAKAERFKLQSAVVTLMPDSSTARCLRWRQKGKAIQVVQSKQHGSTAYVGLQTCSNVWRCPVCSAKVSERRRSELQQAIASHTAAGGQVLLLTLTHPHSRNDDLAAMLDKQKAALKSFTGDRAARKIYASMGQIGSIRAFEVTHGRKRETSHGWHPHYHVLMFVQAGNDLAACGDALFKEWKSACVRAGLKAPDREHGLSLDDGTHAASYASKWGLESEMTRGHTKKKTDGESPFDLLRSYQAEGDAQAGALFVEFALAFHGKRQLYWSKNLKKHFGVGELTDEELAAKQDDQGIVLGTIKGDQWRNVLRVEGRGVLLQVAAKGGWPAVEIYLQEIAQEQDTS